MSLYPLVYEHLASLSPVKLSSFSFFLSSDTALGQEMTIMAGFGVAHKLYIVKTIYKKSSGAGITCLTPALP